jgi:3,4-dihydroxy 2-butanone 4-phosphate synthase/GTP cyclohydrolase II
VNATPENLRYLTTKRDRMGHDLPGLPPMFETPEHHRAVPVEEL